MGAKQGTDPLWELAWGGWQGPGTVWILELRFLNICFRAFSKGKSAWSACILGITSAQEPGFIQLRRESDSSGRTLHGGGRGQWQESEEQLTVVEHLSYSEAGQVSHRRTTDSLKGQGPRAAGKRTSSDGPRWVLKMSTQFRAHGVHVLLGLPVMCKDGQYDLA